MSWGRGEVNETVETARSRTRSWPATLAIVAVGVTAILVYAVRINRGENVEFDRIASMSYEDAMAEIRAHSGGTTSAVFDGKPVWGWATGVAPGNGMGMNPRFFNAGDTPGAVYCAEDGKWFLLGKFKVLDYADGQWRELGVVENGRFTYHPGGGQE